MNIALIVLALGMQNGPPVIVSFEDERMNIVAQDIRSLANYSVHCKSALPPEMQDRVEKLRTNQDSVEGFDGILTSIFNNAYEISLTQDPPPEATSETCVRMLSHVEARVRQTLAQYARIKAEDQ